MDFSELFFQSKGKPITYKDNILCMADHFPFENGDRFLIAFESTNSEWRQGIALYLFGDIEIENLSKKVRDRTVFFENTAPRKVSVKVFFPESKRRQPKKLPSKGLLGIKNVWDTGNGTIDSWHNGAAMIIEEIENGKRYRCNDGHPDENFDDIIFTVQKLPEAKNRRLSRLV